MALREKEGEQVMNLRQAAQQALEALEERYVGTLRNRAIETLEAALAEPEQPVAVFDEKLGRPRLIEGAPMLKDGQALYTAPTPRKPLSEGEIHNIYLHMTGKAEGIAEANGKADFPVLFARALEQMHGIGD